jgi:TRAP-type C4-dicarboxylate transport system permease small subunit
MSRLRKFAGRLSYWFNWIAGGGLVLMMLLTCADVVMRSAGRPIPGTFEIVGFLGVIIAAFAIAYTQVLGGHIAIDYLVVRLSRRRQSIIRCITSLAGAGLFALIAWQSYLFAIPFFPFVYGLALACLPVSLLLLLDFFKSLAQAVRK